MKKEKNGQINSKSFANIHGLEKLNKNNGTISIYYTFKNIYSKCYTYKNTTLPNISSKVAGKTLLVKIKN